MSNGFDKEAEREKLREKFADDDQKREHTQRMSELLLKGATMTNRHCDDCGDPIFRQNGQEFCPSCHTVDAADVEDDSEATAGPAAVHESLDAASQPQSAVTESASNTDAADSDAGGAPQTRRDPAPRPSSGSQSPSPPSHSPSDPNMGVPDNASGGETVSDARESLVRTLTRFARTAETTDDPRRAREQLRAAREAAETLAALD